MDRYFVIKNSAEYALMAADVRLNRVMHAYLIVSPDGGMADALCDLFLSLCVFGNADKESVSRVKTLSADIMRLPHGDKVLTSDVEELTETVYFTPTELDRKYYVIDKCDTMNETCQNKLLKILEEPPSSVIILIKCMSAESLLPTVLSRVKRVDVKPLTESTVTEYLSGISGDETAVYLAAALSQGYLFKGEKVLAEPKYKEIFALTLDMLKNMKTSREVLRFSARISALKDNLADFIDVTELVLADCMAASEGVREGLKFKNAVRDIITISNEYDCDTVLRIMPHLAHARRRLKLNGNPQSVLDELLFSLLEVKAKCRR